MPVRQLSEATVNRIAAGEVVERPASVVKELVENALDAGASRIDVLTDGGGRRLIRVTDDGEGMTRADLALAVERHATSKLADDDLVSIRTLGFRGEALPSIGAVARLSITTRHAGEPHAWAIEVDAGAKSGIKPAALGEGTRVEVRDLFYATPARLKFLKLDRTEAEAVREVVRRLAMSRPDVAFTLAGEERAPVTFAATLPGATGRLARLGDVLGADFRANAVEIAAEREGVTHRRLRGAADAHPRQCARPISVRQRPAGARQASDRRGARGLCRLSAARPPSAGRSVRRARSPREVDVNVHPAKAEVRFRNAGLVRALIVHALKQALAREGTRAATTGGAATIAAFRPARPMAAAARLGLAATRPVHRPQRRSRRAVMRSARRRLRRSRAGRFRRRRRRRPICAPSLRTAAAEAPQAAPNLLDHPLGAARAQVHDTYIVAQTRDGLVIVDQHAAHERIVYERLKAAIDKSGVARQILLIPEIVELDEADVERLARARRRAGALRPGARSLRPGRGGAARDAFAARRDRRRAAWCAILPST